MPYFIDAQDDKYCVRKGTKEDPGEVVKCHPERVAAVAHLRALYVNVEDADKAIGEGQGVDGPKQGEGGVEYCACPECGHKEEHDRGTPCNSMKCPQCGATMGPGQAEKGGAGSGWHAPPLGTHGASPSEESVESPKPSGDTPSGGRAVGEDDEDSDETLHCVCPKCGNKVVLPKGMKCADIECTSCDEQMVIDNPSRRSEQTGEDPERTPSGRGSMPEKMDASANYVHGEGGALSEGQSLGPSQTLCPSCGATIKDTVSVCPRCGAQVQEESEVEEVDKATWDSGYVSALPDSAFLYVESGEKDSEGKTTPRSKRHLPYRNAQGEVDLPHLRNALSRLGQPATGKGWLSEDLRKRLQKKAQSLLSKSSKSAITAYKSANLTTWKADDGHWQWIGISSMAVEDREAEIVTTKAYQDAIKHAEKEGSRGELDVLHLDNTDVGDCTLQHVWGDCLIEGGTWFNTPLAEKVRGAVMARPDYWGMSLKFRYDSDQFDGREYKGGIQILKRTILPRDMAASFGTAIAVTGGEQMKMDERAREILEKEIGLPKEEVDALAEKQKSLPEANVVEKQDERITILSRLGDLLGIGKAKEVTVEEEKKVEAPESEAVEQEKVAQETVAEVEKETEAQEKGPEMAITDEVVKAVTEQVAKSLGEVLGSQVVQAIAPLQEKIVALESQLADATKSVEEKVEERLEELPKIVTVQASQASATKAKDEPQVQVKSADQRFLEDIKGVIEQHTSAKVVI